MALDSSNRESHKSVTPPRWGVSLNSKSVVDGYNGFIFWNIILTALRYRSVGIFPGSPHIETIHTTHPNIVYFDGLDITKEIDILKDTNYDI